MVAKTVAALVTGVKAANEADASCPTCEGPAGGRVWAMLAGPGCGECWMDRLEVSA